MSAEPTVADVFWAQIARIEAIELAKRELLPRLERAFNTRQGAEYIALENEYSKLCDDFTNANKTVCMTLQDSLNRSPEMYNRSI